VLAARFEDIAQGPDEGEVVRVLQPETAMKLQIVDDHTALVPLGGYGHPCLLIRFAAGVAVRRGWVTA
jgi:hypothetical protein